MNRTGSHDKNRPGRLTGNRHAEQNKQADQRNQDVSGKSSEHDRLEIFFA